MSTRLITAVEAAVAHHPPVDDREAASCAQVLAALRGGLRAPFDRHADLTHVTGSAVVVGPRGVVLHLHKKLGIWIQPGGHLEPGEAPADGAVREAHEETGLIVGHPAGGPELWHVDVHPAGGHVHLDLRYLVVAGDDDPSPPEGESQEVAWFGLDEALAVTDASLRPALLRLRGR